MNDLLNRVTASHGGLKRWNKTTLLECEVAVTGLTWWRKGRPDALKEVHVSAHAHDQWISYRPFTGENKRSRCRPAHTIIETLDGQLVRERHDPRSTFADDLHLAYFSGYAMWSYLTTRLLFAMESFEMEELPPCRDGGQEHRRLKVAFPQSIAHCREQVFYVDDNHLIARLGYVAGLSGGVPDAHYLSDYVTTPPVQSIADRTGRFGWRREDCSLGWPWFAGSWRCGSKQRRIEVCGSIRRLFA